ncbi:MAG TPA: 2-phospho-L-lactate guanylyltransferase [Candidatus Nitrosotenuis sp.]|nr:2-phospho-L-lactate guanylyltransferase [Candidatus Nitrosotenuis sp.]
MKALGRAKSRLRGRVADRPALVLRLLDRVLGALEASGCVDGALVVSPDERLEAVCRGPGRHFLRQEGGGLNSALEEARRECLRRGARALLVALADLPRLTAEEVRAMVERLPPRGAVVAPDARGRGTNLLLLRPPDLLPFRFGGASFPRHLAEARRRGARVEIYRAPGTMCDLDTPEQLDLLA